jgi:hypothetical protein
LCRGDAALAEIIRAVAATLEREPDLNESSTLTPPWCVGVD